MIDAILKHYWTPKNMPLWKHHLPTILLGTVLISLWVILGIQSIQPLVPMFIMLIITQIVLGVWARVRFGDKNPKENRN